MSLANRYRGSGFYGSWVYCAAATPGVIAGTVLIAADYTKFEVDRQTGLIKATAGAETDEGYIQGVGDGSAKYTAFDTGSAGSAIKASMVNGNYGTLTYGPQGTATGMPKGVAAFFIKDAKFTEPFDGAVMIDATFQKNGAWISDPFTSSW